MTRPHKGGTLRKARLDKEWEGARREGGKRRLR
jgi:hypothetical protein